MKYGRENKNQTTKLYSTFNFQEEHCHCSSGLLIFYNHDFYGNPAATQVQYSSAKIKSSFLLLETRLNNMNTSEGQIADDDTRCDSAGKATDVGKSGKYIPSVDAMPSTTNVLSTVKEVSYQDGENKVENLEGLRSLSDPNNEKVPSNKLVERTMCGPSSTNCWLRVQRASHYI